MGDEEKDADRTVDPSEPEGEAAGERMAATVVDTLWADTIPQGNDPDETVKATLQRAPAVEGQAIPQDLDDYEILGVIGKGGMGIVYRARQKSLDREVALKTFQGRGDVQQDATYRTMFASEAVVTGNLDHPNIVPIHALEDAAEGPSFYTMKRVQGRPWEDRMDEMSLRENLETLLRVCDAMAFAHDRGIIHRDLKPENVMLGDYGEVLVMDWGLAASVRKEAKAEHIETTHQRGGTPAYMAPEQALDDRLRIGTMTDVYLLGAILFRIVVGRPPHHGKDVMECLRNAAKNRIVEIEQSGEVVDIALKAMSARQQNRHADVESLREDIRNYLDHQESIALTANARKDLKTAEREGIYEKFSRAVFGLEQALSLWPENTDAAETLEAGRDAYARAAFENGDLELALSVVDEESSPDLREQIVDALEERARRQRALRALKWGTIALTAALLISLTVGFLWIRSERNRALRESYFATVRLAAVKIEELSYDEAERLLAGCPERLRGWEWGFLNRLCHLDLLTYTAHGAQVGAVAVQPGGSLVASGDWQGQVRLWNPQSGETVRTIDAHSDIIGDLAFSPDGARLASAGDDGTARVWDAATGTLVATLEGHEDEVWSVAFSPDGGKLATGSMDGTLRIWDAATGEQLHLVPSPEGPVTSVAFSPDGRPAFAYGKLEEPGTIVLLGEGANLERQTLEGHTEHVNCITFSPSGRLLASASWDGTVRVWNTERAYPLRRLPHRGPVFGVAFSADGRYLASCSEDRTVKVWDLESGQTAGTFTGHSGAVGSVVFLPDGRRVVSASTDGTARVWDLGSGGGSALTLQGHQGAVAGVAFSSDGKTLASAGQDGTVRLWDRQTGEQTAAVQTQAGAANAAAFSPDGGTLVVGCWEGALLVLNVTTSDLLHRIEAHGEAVRCVAYSPDGSLVATGGWDGTAAIWDPSTGDRHVSVDLGGFPAQAVAFSPDGDRIAVAVRDGTVRVFEVGTGEAIATLEAHAGWVRAVAFSPDGRLMASAGDDNLVRLWNAATLAHVVDLKGHAKWVKSLAFWPDGRRLVSADDDGAIKVWDLSTRRDLVGWTAHVGTCWSVAVSPDGAAVASAGADGAIKIWHGSDRKNSARK